MRIGIDINEANVKNKVGSNLYAFEILKAIENIDKTNEYTLYSARGLNDDLPKARPGWTYRVLKPSKLWTQWRLPLDLITHKPRPDAFLSLGHYAPRYSPVPTVVIVMDVAFIYFPQFFRKKDLFKLSNWTKYSVLRAKKVIAISNNTKNSLIEQYDIDENKVVVAYPGLTKSKYKKTNIEELDRVKKKYGVSGKYVLYLGTIQPRKNLIRLIKAFEAIADKYKEIDLVLGGKEGWLFGDIKNKLLNSSYKNRIKLTGFIDETDLSAVYAGAVCSLHPGLYEGFGLPVLESLASGTIPVVANTGALPEAVGKAGILVNPYSVSSISQGIEKAIQLDPEEKKKLLEAGKIQLEKFNWEVSANKILEVVYGIANQR